MLTAQTIERLLARGEYVPLIRRVLANGRCCDPGLMRHVTRRGHAPAAALSLALQRRCELQHGVDESMRALAAALCRLQGADGRFGGSATGEASLVVTAMAVRALHVFMDRVSAMPGAMTRVTTSGGCDSRGARRVRSTAAPLAAASASCALHDRSGTLSAGGRAVRAAKGLFDVSSGDDDPAGSAVASAVASAGPVGESAVALAVDRGLAALASRQGADGLFVAAAGGESVGASRRPGSEGRSDEASGGGSGGGSGGVGAGPEEIQLQNAAILWQLGHVARFRSVVRFAALRRAVDELARRLGAAPSCPSSSSRPLVARRRDERCLGDGSRADLHRAALAEAA